MTPLDVGDDVSVCRDHVELSSERLGLSMLSADTDGDCHGGQHHVPVKFGVSARSGCFTKSATVIFYSFILPNLFTYFKC